MSDLEPKLKHLSECHIERAGCGCTFIVTPEGEKVGEIYESHADKIDDLVMSLDESWCRLDGESQRVLGFGATEFLRRWSTMTDEDIDADPDLALLDSLVPGRLSGLRKTNNV